MISHVDVSNINNQENVNEEELNVITHPAVYSVSYEDLP